MLAIVMNRTKPGICHLILLLYLISIILKFQNSQKNLFLYKIIKDQRKKRNPHRTLLKNTRKKMEETYGALRISSMTLLIK